LTVEFVNGFYRIINKVNKYALSPRLLQQRNVIKTTYYISFTTNPDTSDTIRFNKLVIYQLSSLSLSL